MHRTFAATALAVAISIGTAPSAHAASSPPDCNHPADINSGDFGGPIDNPYFPLKPGSTYKYKGKDDGNPAVDTVTVTGGTKQIVGVTTTVVKDKLVVDGELAEKTEDWYAQDKDGNVWYFGEDTAEYENGKVVSTEGSWEAGVDGAKPGIFMPADPKVGDVYQQEYAPGVAEDCFEITDLDAKVKTPFVSAKDALQTLEFSPLEAGVTEDKWYVRKIGFVREKGQSDLFELVSFKK